MNWNGNEGRRKNKEDLSGERGEGREEVGEKSLKYPEVLGKAEEIAGDLFRMRLVP